MERLERIELLADAPRNLIGALRDLDA